MPLKLGVGTPCARRFSTLQLLTGNMNENMEENHSSSFMELSQRKHEALECFQFPVKESLMIDVFAVAVRNKLYRWFSTCLNILIILEIDLNFFLHSPHVSLKIEFSSLTLGCCLLFMRLFGKITLRKHHKYPKRGKSKENDK